MFRWENFLRGCKNCNNAKRDRLRDELAPERPWLAIVRQLFTFPGDRQRLLDAARQKLPEINDWVAAWL